MMQFGIIGQDGSTNGCAYNTPEEAQRQIDFLKTHYPETWTVPLHVVEYWIVAAVNFCRYEHPAKVECWRKSPGSS